MRILLFKLYQLETGRADEIVHLSVDVITDRNTTPYRGQAMLPASDTIRATEPMLDNKQATIWFEDPPHLAKGEQRIGDRTSAQVMTTVSIDRRPEVSRSPALKKLSFYSSHGGTPLCHGDCASSGDLVNFLAARAAVSPGRNLRHAALMRRYARVARC